MSGTVNIARTLFQDEAFKDQPYTEREAFMWLVMEASWKDRTKRVGTIVVDLKRGQLAASIRFMADAWKWEKSTVDRFLKRLEKRDMIGTASGTGVNVITICKYAEYQGGEADSGTAKNEKRDSSGTAAGQTRTPEVIPEVKEEAIASSSARPPQEPDRFGEFWDQYPHRNGAKKGKAPAVKAWQRAIREGPPGDIIAGAMRYAGDRQVVEGYAKDPATWLNQKGWQDEVEQHHSLSPARRGASGSGDGMVAAFAAVAARRTPAHGRC